MCDKLLLYLIDSKYLQFLKNVSTLQRLIFVIFGFSFVIFAVNNFEYLYNSEGVAKVILILVSILLLIGTFLHIVKFFIDQERYMNVTPIRISYCLQLIGIAIGIIYLSFKLLPFG